MDKTKQFFSEYRPQLLACLPVDSCGYTGHSKRLVCLTDHSNHCIGSKGQGNLTVWRTNTGISDTMLA